MTPDDAVKFAIDNGSREEVTHGTKKLSPCYCYDDGAVTVFTDNAHYLVIREKRTGQWIMMVQAMAMVTNQEGFYRFLNDVVPSGFVELKGEAITALCPEGMTSDEYYALSAQAMRTNGLLRRRAT